MQCQRTLKTSLAAPSLGMSQGHLKMQMDCKGGPLIEGVHYFFGPHKTSAIQWDVELCRERFHYLGKTKRAADQVIAALQEHKK